MNDSSMSPMMPEKSPQLQSDIGFSNARRFLSPVPNLCRLFVFAALPSFNHDSRNSREKNDRIQ